jgi:hypothetical protein
MVDWTGMLAWSTKYHDSNSDKSEFSKMDEEKYNFLVEALEEYA